MNQLAQLEQDIKTGDELIKDVKVFDRMIGQPIIGGKVGWYYKDDLKFWKSFKASVPKDAKDMPYLGICVPLPDDEIRGESLDEDFLIIQTHYPCEKCYPEVVYFTLYRLLSDKNVVKIFFK